jgi:hypothetical protein
MRRPRGAAAGAAAGAPPTMYIVRGWAPSAGLAPEEARAIRAPQEPQKAKFACTTFPQFGHDISPAGAVSGSDARTAAIGTAGVLDSSGPGVGALDKGIGAGRGAVATAGEAPSGLGGSWKDAGGANGAGIFGESFQGMPLLGLGVALASSPAAALPPGGAAAKAGAGGRTVLAVSRSSAGSMVGGVGIATRGAGVGRELGGAATCMGGALASSLPHPRQNL